jgi:hypothetical protein
MTIKFVAGDPVKVVGGVYKGRSGVVKKPTEKMYYILLDNGEIVRLMASSVLSSVIRSVVSSTGKSSELLSILMFHLTNPHQRHEVWYHSQK